MEPTIRVNGTDYEYPPADITLGEICDAEQFFGVNFNDPEGSGMRMSAALLWIAIRRVDKTVTVDDVRNLNPELFMQLQGRDVSPPELGNGEPNATSSDGSTATSGRSDGDPSPTGDLGSATSSASGLQTSSV